MKCKHQWVEKGPKIFQWCKICGTLRYASKKHIQYCYPKNINETEKEETENEPRTQMG